MHLRVGVSESKYYLPMVKPLSRKFLKLSAIISDGDLHFLAIS